jgi:hypothetical protein
MTKNLIYISVSMLVLAQLVGCDSGLNGQIEKCVQAGMEANKPYKDNTAKADAELAVRGYCMRSAAGKD